MGKDRLAAFSDGVIAIIITIMVLELKVPHGSDWSALKEVAPAFASYVMSFIYLAIYLEQPSSSDPYGPAGRRAHSLGQLSPAVLAVARSGCDRLDG
jgi:hypothetical protein